MLTHILDGRGPWVPLLDEMSSPCFSCRPIWDYACRFSSYFWSLRVPLVLFVLSWTSLRSSVDIRVMSAPISRRASTLMCHSMMIERYNFLAIPFSMRSPRSLGTGVWEEMFRISELIWCSSEEWQTTKTALSRT